MDLMFPDDPVESQSGLRFPDDPPPPPSTVLGEIPRGLKAGVQQVRGFGYGLGALAGEATGIGPLKEWAKEGLADVEEKTPKPAIGSIADVESASDLGKYLAYGVSTNLPNMLLSFGGGAVGGILGRSLVKDAAKAAIGKAAEKAILDKGLKVGALAGAGLSSIGMEAGSIAGDQLTETGKVEPLRAMAGAIPAGILDVIPEWYLAKKLGWLGKDAAEFAGNRAVRALKVAGQQFAMEAPTEAMQSVIERSAVPGKSITNAEAWDEYINSFILGGATGGVVGGAGGLVTKRANPVVEQLKTDPLDQEIGKLMSDLPQELEVVKVPPITPAAPPVIPPAPAAPTLGVVPPPVVPPPAAPVSPAPPALPAEPVEPVVGKAPTVSPVVEIPVSKIALSKDVPQFKTGATKRGVVEGQELQAKTYRRIPMNPITLWQRNSGALEVVTGRHRLDLAKRLKEETIPAQIVKESEGFTAQDAMTFDAEQNILDNQGSDYDYATYFRSTAVPEADARARGLLRTEKAATAFILGQQATDATFDAYRTKSLNFKQAAAIAKAAPKDDTLQLAGRNFIAKNPRSTALEAENFVKALSNFKAAPQAEQGDMFGYDDTAIRTAEEQAKKVAGIVSRLQGDAQTINAAIRREGKLKLTPEAAAEYGITNPDDKNQLTAARIKILNEVARWDKWYVDPELIARLKGEEIAPVAPVETPIAVTAPEAAPVVQPAPEEIAAPVEQPIAPPAEAVPEATTETPVEQIAPPEQTVEAEPPLRYDPSTDRHNGEKMTRGDILKDAEGNVYRLDRDSGFILTVDQLNEKGEPSGIKSFSIDPADKARYRDLYRTNENAYKPGKEAYIGKVESEEIPGIPPPPAEEFGLTAPEGEVGKEGVANREVTGNLFGKGEAPVKASFAEMVNDAQRWQGAARKADIALGDDKKARLAHSNMTTKGDLDAYLMKKYGVDSSLARDVSNELTRYDLKPDMTAEIVDFRGETWADKALTTPEPTLPRKNELTAIQSYFENNVVPVLKDFFFTVDSMGRDRLIKSGVMPDENATKWLASVMRQESSWAKGGRKTGITGIQMLSQKGLWPTKDEAGENLRKSMLAAVQALRKAPGYSNDWVSNIEKGAYAFTVTPEEMFGETKGEKENGDISRRDSDRLNTATSPSLAEGDTISNIISLKTTDGRDFQVMRFNEDLIKFRYGRLDGNMTMDESYPVAGSLFKLQESLRQRGIKLKERGWEQVTDIMKGETKPSKTTVAEIVKPEEAKFLTITEKQTVKNTKGNEIVLEPGEPYRIEHNADGTVTLVDGKEVKTTIKELKDIKGNFSNEPNIAAGGVAATQRAGGAIIPPPIKPPSTNQPASWDSPEPSRMSNFIYTFIDKQWDLRTVVKAIKTATGVIADQINPDIKQRLYSSIVSEKSKVFLETEFSPLLKEMVQNKVGVDEYQEYLWNRTAEETNDYISTLGPNNLQDGGSGILTADARKYLATLDPKKKAIYERLAKRTDKILALNRDLIVDYQLESQDTVDKWADTYKHYAPLFREDIEAGMGTGEGFSVTGPASKRRKGSVRPVVDILAHIADQRERIITRGEKNKIAIALQALAKLHPNPDFWKIAVPKIVDRIDATTGQMVKVVDMSYLDKDNIVMARVLDPKTKKIVQKGVEFNTRNELATRMASSLKNIDMDTLGQILGTSAKITRFIASMNTQYNPVFGIVNFVRDFQSAMLNLTSTPLSGKQKEVMGHTLPALKAIYTDLRNKGKVLNDPWVKLWEDFRVHGGPTGYRDIFRTSKDRADAIRREMIFMDPQTLPGKLHVTMNVVKNWLSDYNTAAENAVRLSVYKVAIDSGISKDQSAVLAKSITVDFNRKGQIATQAGALYAFFNANAQGSARMIETLMGPAGKKIIFGGITLGVMQAMMMAAAGFGDDDPPEFVRERNLIIPTGGKDYVTIPMPLGLHILPNIGRIPAEWAMGGFKSPMKKMSDIAGVLVESFNPMGASGISLQTITPTPIDPFAALAENKDWTGKQIARPNFSSLSPTPGFTRTKDTAAWFSKQISWALNRLSGGTDNTPGLFSPTADQIDYLLGQFTGGVGREAIKIQQAAQSLTGGEELPTYKIPLAGRFYGSTEGQSNQATAFYHNLKLLNEHEREIKGRREHREPITEYLKDNPEARYWAMANKAESSIARLMKQKRALTERGASKDSIKTIDAAITSHMKRFNQTIKAAES